ncbi:tetratricopeptide repeat protein [Aurantiacibacter marinus]|uniref:Uncharacterized protein n=1 Tax=Aurantiacibacter marinus TaxID=874156 RepID=A0A0H0XPJ2_9SPHN|nr:tetratricopeptide repeat protein [Aurantiacibacter marinus]KLI63921.1 hypothetical protein AAV99_09510 [Aurantiacibacter marinus]
MKSRILTALAVAGLLTGGLGACSLIAPDPMEQAREAFEAQDYHAAREEVLRALQVNTSDTAALELLARIQLAMGLGADVPATLERLENAGTLPVDAKLIEAEALLQTGDHALAVAVLEGEDSAESWRLRALAANMAGNVPAAEAAFVSGRSADGDKRKLFVAAANHHLSRGNADAARFAVGQAQQLSPGSIETLFVSARLAQLDGQPNLAARAYLAILDLSPTDRPALLGAIAELDRLGRIDLIPDLIQRGRTAYPQDIEFIYLTASLQAYEGNWQAARDLLQEHESAAAEHDNARGLYGQALLELGQLELARAQIAPLNRRYPDNAAYARVFARILIELGEHSQARSVIRPIATRSDAQPIDRELAQLAARG